MHRTNQSAQPTLILASGSPRRRDLLTLLGLPFVVMPSEVDEDNHASETAAAMVSRLAQAKAEALLAQTKSGLIIAADTTVSLNGEVLGKPADADDAVKMLRRLRGRAHTVYSSVTLIQAQTGWMRSELAESQVWMRNFSDEEIAAYVSSGDPLDKAGSYAIQYADFRPVERIVGCYANVMGLPLCHLYCMLREAGLAPAQTPVAACDRFNQRRCDVAQQILSQLCQDRGAPAARVPQPITANRQLQTENRKPKTGNRKLETGNWKPETQMITYGSQSMFEPLRRVLVRRPDSSFGTADPARWHYTARPNLEVAQQEHDTLVAILRQAGAEVIYHDEPLPDHADAIFVHDPAIVTDAGAIILRMGKKLRQGEEEAMARAFTKLGVPILYTLHDEATAEGGDLLWLDHNTLAVGQGFRTNCAGLQQLEEALAELGVEVIPVPLPYFGGAEACLHLMSLISILDHDLAVVYPPLLPVPFWQLLRERGFQLVAVPEEEFPTMGPNVLALAPRQCLMLERNPITRTRLEKAGCQVQTLKGDEISFKAEGGPTCLTRPILRGASPQTRART